MNATEFVNQKALMLATTVLDFALSSWVGPENVQALMENLNCKKPEHQRLFLVAFSNFVRTQLADDLFLTPEARDNLVTAIQAVLDELIIRENTDAGGGG